MKKGTVQKVQFFLLMLTLSVIISLSFSWLNSAFFHFKGNDQIIGLKKYELLFAIVLLAPIIETFLFQYITLEFLLKKKINKQFAIAISALLFALTHSYNWLYIVSALLVGVLLAYVYIKTKKENSFPFLTTSLLHSLTNLILFIISQLSK